MHSEASRLLNALTNEALFGTKREGPADYIADILANTHEVEELKERILQYLAMTDPAFDEENFRARAHMEE